MEESEAIQLPEDGEYPEIEETQQNYVDYAISRGGIFNGNRTSIITGLTLLFVILSITFLIPLLNFLV